MTCLVASTVGSTVPFMSSISGSLSSPEIVQWYSTFSLTTSHLGVVPTRKRVPAGSERSTSSVDSRPAASAPPGQQDREDGGPAEHAAAPAGVAAQVLAGGALEVVAEGVQTVGHRVLSLRRAARPRWTRTRAAPGVVPSSRAISS